MYSVIVGCSVLKSSLWFAFSTLCDYWLVLSAFEGCDEVVNYDCGFFFTVNFANFCSVCFEAMLCVYSDFDFW